MLKIATVFGGILLVALGALPFVAASQRAPNANGSASGQFSPSRVQPFETKAGLGRTLFFDARLSGDGATSCASCHLPDKAWTDGVPLSAGYTSTLYFRNTPTLLNASKMPVLDWDGRFSGNDMASLVRDHLTEAHFMNIDGRLLIERLRQVPSYEEGFKAMYGSEVSFGKVLDALAQFVGTLESRANQYLRFRAGETAALSAQATAGLELFEGKAGCSSCHSGELLSDGMLHATGVPANPAIFSEPARHITFRRFFKQFGVGEYVSLRQDPGLMALTHEAADRGKFRTPSLLETARTAPYMHNGVFGSLDEVVRFYDGGGGDSPQKDSRLRPLNLIADEIAALVAFLESLAGSDPPFEKPEIPAYALGELGAN